MIAPELHYTILRLFKGKKIESVPEDSTGAKEEALQNWYVEFFFHIPQTGQMERFRLTKDLNRIKDPNEKLKHFTRLCTAYAEALEGGWNPLDEKANDKLKKQITSVGLLHAKVLFEQYHIAKGTREKALRLHISLKVATLFRTKLAANLIAGLQYSLFLSL